MSSEPSTAPPGEPTPEQPQKKPARKKSSRSVDTEFAQDELKVRTTSRRPTERVEHKSETKTSPAETAKERDSRLKREEAREAHERWKEKAVLVALLVASAAVVGVSAHVLIFTDKTNLHPWASGALLTVLAGLFGWFKRANEK